MKNGAWKSTKKSNVPENQFAAYQDSNSKERAETPSFLLQRKEQKTCVSTNNSQKQIG